MIKIRKEQMDVFCQGELKKFEVRIADFLQTEFPDSQKISKEELTTVIHKQVNNAQSYGLVNRKFITKDGHREVIFTSEGSIDNRLQLKGTFNFFSPNKYPFSHTGVDVDPYSKYGN